MKVQEIKNSALPHNSKFPQNITKQKINFGFGEDYGDDEFLRESPQQAGGNIFEYIGLIIAFPFVCVYEVIDEKLAMRRARREAGAKEKEHDDATWSV